MEAFANYAVALPPEIKTAIAVVVMLAVRWLLSRIPNVPEQIVTEVAGIVTAFAIAMVEVVLGLIPQQWEPVAASFLQLVVVLLGSVLVIRAYTVAHAAVMARKKGAFRI